MEQHHQKAASQLAVSKKPACRGAGESLGSEGIFDAAMRKLTTREWQELASQRLPLTPAQHSAVESVVREVFAEPRDTKPD